MKKHILAIASVATLMAGVLSAGQAVAADEGPWMVRARAVHLDSANTDNTSLGLTINNKWLPEVDISYFIDKNWAIELILTVPQKHTLYSKNASIGTLKHLPPTLTAQYHFDVGSGFKPYVGLGLNYTNFSSVKLTVPGAGIDKNSFGLAVQAGFDFEIDKNLYLNFDVKKAQIRTDVDVKGSKLGTFKVDPILVGIGVGMRF